MNNEIVVGTPTKKAKLVSYIDPDAGLSDDERDSGDLDDVKLVDQQYNSECFCFSANGFGIRR